MGGYSYDRDVGSGSSTGSFSTGGTSSASAKKALGRSGAHAETLPLNRIVSSNRKNPIVIGLDVTGSNIEFAGVSLR